MRNEDQCSNGSEDDDEEGNSSSSNSSDSESSTSDESSGGQEVNYSTGKLLPTIYRFIWENTVVLSNVAVTYRDSVKVRATAW